MAGPTFTAPRGDTFTSTLTVTGDLTGWVPRLTIKGTPLWTGAPDADAVLTLTAGSGLTVTPGALSSTVAIGVSAATMATIDPGVYVWDLQLTSGGVTRTVVWDTLGTTTGSLTVTADVTRTTP